MTTPDNRQVSVQLSANVQQYQSAMEAAGKQTDSLTGKVASLARSIDDLVKKTSRKLILIGTGESAGLVAAAEAANRLDIAFTQVRSTAAITGQSVAALDSAARKLSQSIPMSTGAIAQMMGQVQDLGVRGTANIVKFTEVAEKLAAATNTSPGQLLSGIVQLSRTMGSSYQDVERYSSALVSLSKTSGVSAQGILDFSNAIEAVAQRAGYSQTQVLGIATAFSKAGADGMTAAQLFNRVTTDISTAVVTGSSQLTTYANLIGVSRDQLKAMARDNPADVFVKVVDSLKSLGNQGLIIQQQLGLDSPRIQRTLAAITSGQSDIRTSIEQSNDAFNKNTALSKAADASYASLSKSMEQFRNSIDNAVTTIGGPFIGIMSKVVDVGTRVVNIFNDLPGPVKTGVSAMAGLAAAGTVLAGVIGLVGLNVLKIGLLFRAFTLQPIAQAFNGLRTSMSGSREFDPQYMEGRTRAMQRMYMESYKLGNALRNVGGSSAASAGGSVAGSILRFPLNKIKAEGAEFWDTLKNPLPSQRDPNKNSPYGVAGAGYQIRNAAVRKRDEMLNSDDPRVASAARMAFGDPQKRAEESQGKILSQADRLTKASEARAAAEREVVTLLKQESAESINQMIVTQEAIDKAGKKKFVARDASQVTPQEREAFINSRAKQVGAEEFTKVKAQLEEEANVEVSAIQKIFAKVKTMAAELSTVTANGVTEAFNATKAGFAAAVEQIVALARVAQEQLATLRAGGVVAGGGAAYEQALNLTKTGLNLPKSMYETVAGKVQERAAPNPLAAFPGVVGTPGRNVSEFANAGRAGAATAMTEAEAAGHMSTFSQYAKIATTGFGVAARGAMALGGGLLSLVGGPMGALFMGLTVLAPIIDHLAHAGRDAAEQMGAFGEEAAKSLGLTFAPHMAPGSSSKPADNSPFGTAEKQNALSGTFSAAHSGDMARLNAAHTDKQRLAVVQSTADSLIDNANKGGAATTSEQQYLREMLVRAYNGDTGKAQKAYDQLQLGAGGANFSTRAADTKQINQAIRTDSGGLLPAAFGGQENSGSSQSLIKGQADQMSQAANAGDFSTVSALLHAQGMDSPNQGGWNIRGIQHATDAGAQFQATISKFVDDYNKGKTDSEKITAKNGFGNTALNMSDFLRYLNDAGGASKRFASQLEKNNTTLEQYAAKMQAQVSDPNSLLNRISATSLGGTSNQYGLELSNVQGENYNRNMGFALGMVGAGGDRSQMGAYNAANLGNQRTALRQQIGVINNPADPQQQDLSSRADALTGQIMAQQNQFATGAEAAQNYANDLSLVAQEMGSTASSQDAFASSYANTQNAITSAENTLRGYLQQVHDYGIQQQRTEQDHTLQLTRMYRDRGTQLQEINYQENRRLVQQAHDFNESIRSSTYELANVFGGAAQQVSAQYTQGASTMLLGMDRQVQYLQRSKAAMDQLQSQGVSTDTIRVLGLDDPKQYEQAEKLAADLAADPKMVAAFNASIKNRLKISNGIATDSNNSKFADMKRQFDYTAKMAADAFTHSQQVSDRAFQVSLGDFTLNYQTAQQRAEADLQRIGENLFSNLNTLLNQGLHTGVANITTFTQGIQRAMAAAQTGFQNFYAGMQTAPGGGGGGSGPTGSFGDPVTGGGVSGQGGVVGDTGTLLMQRSGPDKTAYINPGTGLVVSGVQAGDRAANASHDYRPDGNFMKQHPANPSFNQNIAKSMAPAWAAGNEWQALYNLWNRESGWNQYADNTGSDAYGIPQSLPGTKMASAGSDWRTNPATQIAWGLQYIASTYQDPVRAWEHEQRAGWYATGGIFESATNAVIGEAGPEAVIPLDSRGASFMANIVRAFMPTSSRLQMAGQMIGSGSSSLDTSSITKGLETIGLLTQEVNKSVQEVNKSIQGLKLVAPDAGGTKTPAPGSGGGTKSPDGKYSVDAKSGVINSGTFKGFYPAEADKMQAGGVVRDYTSVHGTLVHVNTKGIIDTQGSPYYGKYPAEVNGGLDPSKQPGTAAPPPSTNGGAGSPPAAKPPAPVAVPAPSHGWSPGDPAGFVEMPPAKPKYSTDAHSGVINSGPYYGFYPEEADRMQAGAIVRGYTSVHGTLVHVNSKSIIDTKGAYYGKYPAEVNGGLQGRATGGPVSPRTPYMVGERGPELFIPAEAGNIMTNVMTMDLLNKMRQNSYASQTVAGGTHGATHMSHSDHSFQVHGDVHVEANDPNAMANALAQRKRLMALSRPHRRS